MAKMTRAQLESIKHTTETGRLYGKARQQIASIREMRATGLCGESACWDLFRRFRNLARQQRTTDKFEPACL